MSVSNSYKTIQSFNRDKGYFFLLLATFIGVFSIKLLRFDKLLQRLINTLSRLGWGVGMKKENWNQLHKEMGEGTIFFMAESPVCISQESLYILLINKPGNINPILQPQPTNSLRCWLDYEAHFKERQSILVPQHTLQELQVLLHARCIYIYRIHCP